MQDALTGGFLWVPQDIVPGVQPPSEAPDENADFQKQSFIQFLKEPKNIHLPHAAAGLYQRTRPCSRHGAGRSTRAWDAWGGGQELTRILPRPLHNWSADFANLNKTWCPQLCILGFNPVLFFSKALLCWNTSNQFKLNNLPRENVQRRWNTKVCAERGLTLPLF